MKNGNKNVFIYYLIMMLTNAWFVEGNWIFFWTKLVNYETIGIIFALSTAWGLLMEVPTGAFADKYGRKNSTVLGLILSAAGFLAIGIAADSWPLLVGALLQTTGAAFLSGSLDALVYDDLKSKNREKEYEKVIAKSNTLAIVTDATTILIGGGLYLLNFRFPYLATTFVLVVASVLALELREPVYKSIEEKLSYWEEIKDGLRQVKNKSLRIYLPLLLMIDAVFWIYDWGFAKPNMAINFGLYDKEQAILYSSLAVLAAVIMKFLPKIRKTIGDYNGLILFNILLGTGFVISFWKIGWWGVIPMAMVHLSGYLSFTWISIIVNKRIESKHRATTLSALTFLAKLPYFVTIVFAGSLIDRGFGNWFQLGIGAIVLGHLGYQISRKGIIMNFVWQTSNKYKLERF